MHPHRAFFMKYLAAVRYLSIEVALGACAGAWWVAQFAGVELPWAVYIGLFFSVAGVYAFDRLVDISFFTASTPRHQFYFRFKAFFWAWLGICALGVLSCVFFVPAGLLLLCAGWAGLIGGYFVGVASNFKGSLLAQSKEVAGALLYAGGVCLPTVFYTDTIASVIGFFGLYFLLAWANLLLFACFDYSLDKVSGQRSFATERGLPATRKRLHAVFFLLMCWGIILGCYGGMHTEILLFAFMGFVHFLIFIFSRQFTFRGVYRIICDGAFLAPYLFWMCKN
jgi:hypothetical protein